MVPSLLRRLTAVSAAVWRACPFIVSFVLVLEIATRTEQAISYGAPILGSYTYWSALTTFDEHGVVGKPNGRFEKWTLNSFGFRGPEIDTIPAPEVRRIVCLGASETFGLFEAPGNEWPRQLERFLRAEGHNVEVLNASLAGTSLRYRIDQFERRTLPLRPEVAILMLDYVSYAKTAGDSVEETEEAATEDRDPVQERREGSALRLRFPGKLKDALIPHLPTEVDGRRRRISARFQLSKIRRNLGDAFQSVREVGDEELAAYRNDVHRFISVARANGVQVLLLAPGIRLDEKTMLNFATNFPHLHPDWAVEAWTDFLDATTAIAVSRQVPLLDLDSVVSPDKRPLMSDTFHFSDAGAEVVARAVADELRLEDALRDGPRSVTGRE